MSQEGVEGA
jgi:hypothetical protein